MTWFEGVGEHTGQPADTFQLVTFGSSFNVMNRQEALAESQRILRAGGWFACMWNHRDLKNPIQEKIENIIRSYVKDYAYGARRENQIEVIRESRRFEDIRAFNGRVIHPISVEDVIEGWRSHGTLYRQAGNRFSEIIADIAAMLHALGTENIVVLYETHVWMPRILK